MAELLTVERLLLADRGLSAAQRFQQRMRQVRIENGLEEVEEPSAEEAVPGVTVRLSDPLVAYVAELLEGRDGLLADTLRITLGLPVAAQDDVCAGQGTCGGMHSISCSVSTPTTRQRVHPFSRRKDDRVSPIMVTSRKSVGLAA